MPRPGLRHPLSPGSVNRGRARGAAPTVEGMADYVKKRTGAPQGFFAAEADGLRWLAEARAVPVVEVFEVGDDFVRLERLTSISASADAAREFGAGLARLHDAGAPAFGWTPSETAWFGPLDRPFPVSTTAREAFAQYWAGDRLAPLARTVATTLGAAGARVVDEAIEVIAAGAFDGVAGRGAEPPARVHGDLWAGNLMWTPGGATLIDPAAHGGHRLEDLALLSLFGAPYLDDIFAGYERQHPMPASWRRDLPAHLLFALLAHVRLFGSIYAEQAVAAADAVIARGGEFGR